MSEGWQDELVKLKACKEAVEWAEDYSTFKEAWNACRRGDWMLWLLAKRGADRKRLMLAACECVRLALKHVPDDEDRPRKAIEAAEAWTRGEATTDEVRAAAYAAYAASAAHDAANAASAAGAVAHDATAAHDAAYDAASAAGAVARTTTLAKCADIVRKHFPSGEAP